MLKAFIHIKVTEQHKFNSSICRIIYKDISGSFFRMGSGETVERRILHSLITEYTNAYRT
mgnify:CR=1 FL=1